MDNTLHKRLEEIGAPDDIKALAAELAEQALRDPLTGLYNRRFFDEALRQNIDTARRYKRELSLVLFDIDRLKEVNDTAGHEAGDAALRTFAEVLQKTARAADIVCRIGGDEFAIILPETERSNVWKFTDRVFQTLEKIGAKLPILGKKQKNISKLWNLTASFGTAELPSENLFAEADAALLTCKRKNRSIVEI